MLFEETEDPAAYRNFLRMTKNDFDYLLNLVAPSDVKLPYVLVGDDAFAMGEHLMKPYAHKNLSGVERIFSYRLSRARRTIENVYGTLAARFRVFHKTLLFNPEKCRTVTKAACVLHNFFN